MAPLAIMVRLALALVFALGLRCGGETPFVEGTGTSVAAATISRGCSPGEFWTLNMSTGAVDQLVRDEDCGSILKNSVLDTITASRRRLGSSTETTEIEFYGDFPGPPESTGAILNILPRCRPLHRKSPFDHLEGFQKGKLKAGSPIIKLSMDIAKQTRHMYNLSPKSVDVLVDTAIKWQNMGRPDYAIECYRTIYVTFPSHARALISLASLLVREEFWSDAIEVLELAQKSDPLNYLAYLLLGDSHRQQGTYEEAREYAQFARSIKPDEPAVLQLIEELDNDANPHTSELWRFKDLIRQRTLGTFLLLSVCFVVTSVAVTQYIGATKPDNIEPSMIKASNHRKSTLSSGSHGNSRSSTFKPAAANQGRKARSTSKRRK